MPSKALASLAVLLGLAVLPAFGQSPSAANSELTTPIMTPFQPGMFSDASTDDSSFKSSNWAGYVVTGSDFTEAQGSWVVPPYHCIKTPTADSGFFVGIDGYSDTTIEAIGTMSNCVGSHYQYYAWYSLPTIKKIPSFSVNSGDVIWAEVRYVGSEFTVTITDETTGNSFSTSAAVPWAKQSSAEWIVLKTSGVDLMDFGKASSGDDYTNIALTDWAADSTLDGPIGFFGSEVVKVTMVNTGGTTLAAPTALTTDGTSFKVNWKHE